MIADWRRKRVAVDALFTLCMLLAGLWTFREAVDRVRFDRDELDHISSSRFFDYFFVQQDLSRREWTDANYWTHDHPVLARYIIGASLWTGGYSVDERLKPYDASKTLDENRRQGLLPDDVMLARARAPMVLLASGAVALLYLLGRTLDGVIAGLAASLLALGSPHAQEHLVRALPDAPLMFFVLLALLIAIHGARRCRRGRLTTRWAIAIGIALGLGLSSKLTAVLSVGAATMWGVLVVIARWGWQTRQHALRREWSFGRGWLLTLLVAFGVFTVCNPHLYDNPFLHTMHLFKSQADEMAFKVTRNRTDAIRNPLDRPYYVFGGSLVRDTATGSRGFPVEAGLAATGFAMLIIRGKRGWRRVDRPPAEGLVVVTLLFYFLGITWALLQSEARYWLPTLLLGNLLSGLGFAVIIHQLLRHGAHVLPILQPSRG